MLKKTIIYIMPLIALLISACAEDDSFTTSPSKTLTFSTDSIDFDTLFSRVPSSTRTFWIYNNSGKNIRCSNIRLENGNQTGFRVNVNGIYLGKEQGFQMYNEEIRNKDSIRVFVEITPPDNGMSEPQHIKDHLVFMLESGVRQEVRLEAYAWDAEIISRLTISSDTVLSSHKPLVIRNSIDIEEGATLTLAPGKTLYMHNEAMINVHGRLVCEGAPGNEVVLRGDRLDNMFDYLPYDGVSGQWGGIRIYGESYGNIIRHTDIHGANTAICCDSAETVKEKIRIENSTIHNNKGYGIYAEHCKISINNTQVSNSLNDCIAIVGGAANINHCTIAQFYPFDGNRGAAFSFANNKNGTAYPLEACTVRNSIITGYAEDVVMAYLDDTAESNFLFDHCILRTPEIDDTTKCANIIWENAEDTVTTGSKNFILVDTELLQYDFHLSDISKAINSADKSTSLPADRNATKRDDEPDMGCYEAVERAKRNSASK